MQPKCIIQRCYTPILQDGQYLYFQHSFGDAIQEVTSHCIQTIMSVGVMCNKRTLHALPTKLRRQVGPSMRYFETKSNSFDISTQSHGIQGVSKKR